MVILIGCLVKYYLTKDSNGIKVFNFVVDRWTVYLVNLNDTD